MKKQIKSQLVKLSDVVVNHTLALENVTKALQNVTAEQLPSAVEFVNNLESVAKTLKSFVKSKAIDYIKEHGEVVTDKGGMSAQAGDSIIRMRPWRTGVDVKKLESLLRRKSVAPERCCNPVVSYKYDETKTLSAINAGVLTQAELETCYYDEQWVVLGPKDSIDSND